MKLKSYLKTHEKEVRTLNVWDIDATLGNTDARVSVLKNGKVVKVLDPGEFNKYQLKQGESFDFSQFRSGKIFRDTFISVQFTPALLNTLISVQFTPDRLS